VTKRNAENSYAMKIWTALNFSVNHLEMLISR